MTEKPKIGIFDSGIGGFSVLRACLRTVSRATYYYYGDNLRAPYGSRPTEEIAAFTEEALQCFAALHTDVAVLACNTATAVCIEEMRKKFSFPVVGVEPAVAPAAAKFSRVLVLATPRTAESPRLRALLSRFPQTRFCVYAPKDLAAAIEAHFLHGKEIDLSEHLPADSDCECAVLGCTHYALLREEIAHYLGMPTFDGAEGTARRVFGVLRLGNFDHFRPHADFDVKNEQNPLLCSDFDVNFLGSGHHVNECMFESNIRFNIL